MSIEYKRGRATELRVHIGAHKTGTTHLQAALTAAQVEIRSFGATYIPLEQARSWFSEFPYSVWGYRAVRVFPISRRYILRQRVRDLLGQIYASAVVDGWVVISEEDIIGNTQCLMECKFYPHLAKLHVIEEVAKIIPTKLFITIRSLDQFLVSAYAESIKGRRLSRRDFEAMASFFLHSKVIWYRLVKRIMRASPSSEIEVWVYDDYRENWRSFLSRLTGQSFAGASEVSIPNRTRTPSERAILDAESLALTNRIERHKAVRALFAEDLEHLDRARFDPFSDTEKKNFRCSFEQDINLINRKFPGLIKRF